MIDVGQGDSILIQSNNQNMLIDAGTNASENKIVSYLKQNNVDRLDYVIATHPHEDHIGGLDYVVKTFEIGEIIMPEKLHTTQTFENLLDAIESKKLQITKPVKGQSYKIGSGSFTILGPIKDYDNLNDVSVGIKLINGNNSFVMCGDAEEQAELDIKNNNSNLKANVLKLGHHGSSTSTNEQFLNAISPEFVVISVGAGNSYGHPHQDTLKTLKDKNIKLFRTDMSGTIVFRSDGTNITCNVTPVEIKIEETKVVEGQKTPTSSTPTVVAPVVKQNTQTYVLNTNSKKFHYSYCSSVTKMKDSNKKIVESTRESLISQNYDPCKICNP